MARGHRRPSRPRGDPDQRSNAHPPRTISSTPQPSTKFSTYIRHAVSYGNTRALIQDAFRASDGSLGSYRTLPNSNRGGRDDAWLREKQRLIFANTKMLEVNDYSFQARATCQPAHLALAPYLKFKKLFGERKYASNYQPYPASTNLTTPTGFLDLPAELRNLFYSEWFIFESPFEFLPKSSRQTRLNPYRVLAYRQAEFQKKTVAARRALRINKQFNKEASSVFYGENEFRFTGSCGWIWLRAFMTNIGKANTACLRIITVHVPWLGKTADRSDSWNLIKGCNADRGCLAGKERIMRMPLDQIRILPVAHKEDISIFNRIGTLAELNLVLPRWFDVENVVPLDLQPSQFKHGIKVKMIHLDTFEKPRDNAFHSSQQPLRQDSAPKQWRECLRRTYKTAKEWESPKAYANSQGWEFVEMKCDDTGNYPEKEKKNVLGAW